MTQPPAAGYPVAILFHGSFFDASTFWDADGGALFGAVHQVELVAELLRRGFAVVTPDAALGTYWNTNAPPWSVAWSASPDRSLMDALLAKIARGALGPMDSSRLYAAGISSGGYMTSRMALAYPGRFRALAIHSASYATCSGAACRVPDDLPPGHPPTMFLHGEQDDVVPIETAERYAQALATRGINTDFVRDGATGHAWLAESPTRIAAWFEQH